MQDFAFESDKGLQSLYFSGPVKLAREQKCEIARMNYQS